MIETNKKKQRKEERKKEIKGITKEGNKERSI